MSKTRLFQIVDHYSNTTKEINVSSLNQLVQIVQEEFSLTDNVKVVLESDGTIVDDEEYFATLESNTCLTVLKSSESWNSPAIRCNTKDEVDFTRPDLDHLLKRLKNDASQLVLFSNKDLELLSNINPETSGDFPDQNFLRNIQEACTLYLNDRRDAKDYIELMKMYHSVTK